MTPYPPADRLQRLGDFALAQVFRPHEAARYAAQVLLPAPEGLPAGPGLPTPWISVEDLVSYLSTAVYTAVYEVYEARLMGWLQGCAQDWPTLWREAVVVYVKATFGVDLTDAAQRRAAEQEAHEALWEAHQALYGAPNT